MTHPLPLALPFIRVLSTALALGLATLPASAEQMRMAVTTSFLNSGLAEILLPAIQRDTGLDLQLLAVGTGQALQLGQAGDVDAVLVHARTAEEAFVAAGHATHRREIMYNDFIFVGPQDDPAGVNTATTATQALEAIAAAGAPFVSRGDDSGTHQMELALWQTAGITPQAPWYAEVGAGMGASLNTASGMGAYILTDRASWLNFGNKDGMAMVFEGDPALFNQYAYLPVNPDRHAHVKADAAALLEDWLTSGTAQALIDGYTIADTQLFTFNAK